MSGGSGATSGNQAGSTSATGPADPRMAKKASHTRTEFVVLFIWREPRPSDRLMPKSPPGEPGVPNQGPGKGSKFRGMGGMSGMSLGGRN